MDINGQWLATLPIGEAQATAMLDVEFRKRRSIGSLTLVQQNRPTISGNFVVPEDEQTAVEVPLRVINAKGEIIPTPQLEQLYPGWTLPAFVSLRFEPKVRHLNTYWQVGRDEWRRVPLIKSQVKGKKSALRKDRSIRSWDAYKRRAAEWEPGSLVFRGQSFPWCLQTRFHRTGRSNLNHYLEDVHFEVHRTLSARTKHLFNLQDPQQFGAFLNLLQHYGFPTPLLDWSRSPFVAAFFAYRFARAETEDKQQPVRIVTFDLERWVGRYQQLSSLASIGPHFSVLEAVGIENERMVPQQALSTVTNVNDIEAYVNGRNIEGEAPFLQAIDLPYADRADALRDLSMMGITAASMFGGLDGACEALRNSLFGFNA